MLEGLELLKHELLTVFLQDAFEKDEIKRFRKILKEFKDHIYSGDSLLKILSTSQAVPSSLSGQSSVVSSALSQSSSSQNNTSASGGNNNNAASEMGSQKQHDAQQRFLLIAACEEIQKLLKFLPQPLQIAKNCQNVLESPAQNNNTAAPSAQTNSSGTSISNLLQDSIKNEFNLLIKKLQHVLRNYSDVLPLAVSSALQSLSQYYEAQLKIYLDLAANNPEQLKTLKYSQIQAPALGYYLFEESKANLLFEKASTHIGKLRVQRVGTEFVHHFQKYLITYVFNKYLMDADILPGIVLCLKDAKKKKTFFFIQYDELQGEEINQATATDQQIYIIQKSSSNNIKDPQGSSNSKEQQEDKKPQQFPVDMNSFFKQIAASFLSLSLESFIPNYSVCTTSGKIYRHQLSTTNEDRSAHAGLKNPLYFFKESLLMQISSKEDFSTCIDLERCNMANFLGALSSLYDFQKTDFKFEFKKGRKINSLFLPKEHINALQGIVQEFSRTQVWLAESVFPVQTGVCLLQVVQQVQPVVVEFSARFMSKTIQEHMGFMKRISIEDFLLKVSSKKALRKYIQQNKLFEDPRFIKDDLAPLQNQQINQFTQGNNSEAYSRQQGMVRQNSNANLPGTSGGQQPLSPLVPSHNNNMQISSPTTGNNSNANTNNTSSNINNQTPIVSSKESQNSGSNPNNSTNSQSSSQSSNSQSYGNTHNLNSTTISSSGVQIMQYLMELNLLGFHKKERKVILKFSSENLLFMPVVLSLEQSQDMVKRFNKSWRSTQLWSDNYSFTFGDSDEETEIEKQTDSDKISIEGSSKNSQNVIVAGLENIKTKNSTSFNSQTMITQSLSTPMKRVEGRISQEKNLYFSKHNSKINSKNLRQFPQIPQITTTNRVSTSLNAPKTHKSTKTSSCPSNASLFESIFVELLGLIFNMNIMSILTTETFHNLSYFEETDEQGISLIRNYLRFPQVRGDKGFRLCSTLLEQSVRLGKYRLAGLLLDAGEGINIRKEILFDYLSEVHYFQGPSISVSGEGSEDKKICSGSLTSFKYKQVFDEKLQDLVKKHHPTWLNEFNWEKLWRQQFNPKNHVGDDHLLVLTHSYGVRCLPYEIWTQLFEIHQQVHYEQDNEEELSQQSLCKDQSHILSELQNNNNNSVIDEQQTKQQNEQIRKNTENEEETIREDKERSENDQDKNINERKVNESKEEEEENQLKNNEQQEEEINEEVNEEEQQQQQLQGQSSVEDHVEEGNVEVAEIVNYNETAKEKEQPQDNTEEKQESPSKLQESDVEDLDNNNNQIQDNQPEKINEENEKLHLNNLEGTPVHSPKNEDEEEDKSNQVIDSHEKNNRIDSNHNDITNSNLKERNLHENDNNSDFEDKDQNNLSNFKVNQTVRLPPLKPFASSGQERGTLKLKRISYEAEQNYMVQAMSCGGSSQLVNRLGFIRCEHLDLCVEQSPQSYFGLQYAADSFVKILSDSARSSVELITIDGVVFVFRQVLHNCKSLNAAFQERKPFFLERSSLGERILLAMLLNQQQAGPGDEILEAHPVLNKEFRLLSVSQSLPFVSEIIRHHSTSYLLNVRNLIFCMDSMHDEIDQGLFMKFRAINPEKLLDDWLNDLYFEQQKIQGIKSQKLQASQYFKISQQSLALSSQKGSNLNENLNNNAEEAILFQKSMIKNLYSRLLRMSKYLKKIHIDEQHGVSMPKYQDVFEVVCPLLANLYKQVNTIKSMPLLQRYQMLQTNLDTQHSYSIQDLPSFYANFSLHKIEAYQSLSEVISSFQSVGPLAAKEIIKSLTKLTRKDHVSWEDAFNNVSKNSHARTILMNGQLESDWTELSTTEKIIQQLQIFQSKPVQEFKHLLSELIFDHSESLTLKMLRNLSLERITILSLKGCNKITDNDVVRVSESMPLLVFLDISQNSTLLKLNHTVTSRILVSKPLQFHQLKTLILDNCQILTILDIEAPHLQNLSLSFCPSLVHLFTTAPQLKRINLNSCASLLEEHAALYLIDGTNTLLDESTSAGIFKHLLASFSLTSNHSKLHIYKQSVQAIFGRLFCKIKNMYDVQPLTVALSRRGLNTKSIQTKESSSSSFFGFSKKSSTATAEASMKSCKMGVIQLLLGNTNIRELKFLHICEEIRESIVSPLLSDLAEKLQEFLRNSPNQSFDIDSIDFSDVKLTESNMKHLGLVVSLLKSNSPQGLSIHLQASQESQNDGIKFICEGAIQNSINKMDLSKNRLGTEQLEEICKMIETAKSNNKINQLFLKNCRINNKLLGRIGQAVMKNDTLRLLDLSDNYFDHEGLSQFMPCLYDNNVLGSLVLDGNALRGEGFKSIRKARFLKRLNLEQCDLENQEIEHVCWLISEYQQLNYLDLSYNKVNLASTQQLVSSLTSVTCLKELIIKKIFEEDESVSSACRFAELIGSSNSLQTIDMSGNCIGNDGLIHIGRGLATNSSLRILTINDDQTVGLRGIAHFAELLTHNSTLQILEMSSIEGHADSQLEGFKAAWEAVNQKINENKAIRHSKKQQKESSPALFHTNFNYQKKQSTSSPTQRSLDQSSFFAGEKLDSHRTKGNSDHFRLGLSIDGGGMRGIIPATIIQYICQQTKRQVHDIFDVVGGTSIGGILALGLTCTLDGTNPVSRGEDLPEFLLEKGSLIFNSSKMVALWNNLRDKSKYDAAGIESVMKGYFQNSKLSDVLKSTNVIVTAMKRENIQGKNMAKIFRSKEASFSDEKNFFIRDVARATSAAPTYFSSAEIKNINGTKKYSLIDGALGQNNPSKLVLDDIKTEALNSGNEKNFFLLSISTGQAITTQQISQNAGIFNLVPIINSLGEGSLAFLDKDIEKSSFGQYCRINPDIPIKKQDAELDNCDPKILEIYKQVAQKAAEKQLFQDLKYGPFNDQNLLDWLSENTARKKDTYI